MTDSDIRSLKCYLTECLESAMKDATARMEGYQQEEAKNSLDTDIAAQLRRYYQGQSDALRHAIAEFKELFEEELKEGE